MNRNVRWNHHDFSYLLMTSCASFATSQMQTPPSKWVRYIEILLDLNVNSEASTKRSPTIAQNPGLNSLHPHKGYPSSHLVSQ